MRKLVLTFCVMAVLLSVGSLAFAGFESMTEGQAKGITDGMINDFKLNINKTGQETTTGCANNPMERSGNEPILPPEVKHAELPQYEHDYDDTSWQNGEALTFASFTPNRPYYPSDTTPPTTIPDTTAPETPVTPEPGTLLVMGLGLAALAPFAKKRRKDEEVVE